MPLNLFNQTISYTPKTGKDKYNKPTYGSAFSVKAREQKTVELLSSNGNQDLVQSTVLYIENKGTAITAEGIITLSDSTIHPILAVKPEIDKIGNIHHYKIWLGVTQIRKTR
jgi:hypothetical protein